MSTPANHGRRPATAPAAHPSRKHSLFGLPRSQPAAGAGRETGARPQLLDPFHSLRFTASWPEFNTLLMGNEPPTEAGTIALAGRHLASDG